MPEREGGKKRSYAGKDKNITTCTNFSGEIFHKKFIYDIDILKNVFYNEINQIILGERFMVFLVIGVITLFLTGFMIIYYGYLFKNTDHDVSFFFSVGIISMVMNLFTNMSASAAVLSILYLIIAVVFLGVGFAIDLQGSIAFYTSIGGWFQKVFGDTENLLWTLLCFILSPVGLVLFFVYYNSNHERALLCGKAGLWGLLVELLLLWAVLGLVSGIGSIDAANETASLLGNLL